MIVQSVEWCQVQQDCVIMFYPPTANIGWCSGAHTPQSQQHQGRSDNESGTARTDPGAL